MAPSRFFRGYLRSQPLLDPGILVRKLLQRGSFTSRDDLRAELDARFALMAGEVKRLFSVLEPALKLSKAEA